MEIWFKLGYEFGQCYNDAGHQKGSLLPDNAIHVFVEFADCGSLDPFCEEMDEECSKTLREIMRWCANNAEARASFASGYRKALAERRIAHKQAESKAREKANAEFHAFEDYGWRLSRGGS